MTAAKELDAGEVLARFPDNGELGENQADQRNPAIRLYGRRFYKDQTPIEYLAEFLLVFASPKKESAEGAYQLRLNTGEKPRYWPQDRVALKLFSFFPSSKLETRHPAHRQTYMNALQVIKQYIDRCNEEEKDETIRLLQSLFSGFVGVAKNRTWVTHTFFPASTFLLSHEVTWEHPKASSKKNKDQVIDWDSSKKYFDQSTHNFLGRGGELLFLQLANLAAEYKSPEIINMIPQDEYKHLGRLEVIELIDQLEYKLKFMLDEAIAPIGELVQFIENSLEKYKLNEKPRLTNLGWVPVASRIEALLFAVEMHNICSSLLSTLEKLELLQTLCCMQVLRSLCFQARRIDRSEKSTVGFIGNYAWIVTDPDAIVDTPIRKMAQTSFDRIDEMLYRVIRTDLLGKSGLFPSEKDLKNGDDNGFRHFRKFSKEIGLVIPKKGAGQRFTLHQELLRFLVAALLNPGERIRLTEFYQRIFAHYGIAISGSQLAIALEWNGSESGNRSYAIASSTAWVEEALQQGGFLVELSDAVSIVHNPGLG
ncbi:MAG: hypothetical protein IPL99_19540 [Candidatus Competibacteraceae bacterium]|nr:hypothetical protein [Candidatus Competibacteraceae bacterium]